MKAQTVILRFYYDENEKLEPRLWNWPEIIGCDYNCVEVMNYSGAECVEEKTRIKKNEKNS